MYTTNFDLSPDGTRIAVAQRNPENSRYDIWLIDVGAEDVPTRFTFDPALSPNGNVVWSPDGLSHRVFVRAPREPGHLRKKGRDGAETPLLDTARRRMARRLVQGWAYLAYGVNSGHDRVGNLYVLPLFGDRKPILVSESPFAEDEPRFSSMANGWPTTQTSRARSRSTSFRFRRSIKNARSRPMAAYNHDGDVTERNFTIWLSTAP